MDKLINSVNWDFIGAVFSFLFQYIILPLGSLLSFFIISPVRKIAINILDASHFVKNLKNSKHEMYYEGMVSKVKTLHDKHEEENSDEVKKLQAIIAEYQARDKANEKKGFEKLQESFEKLEGNVESALDKLVDHDRRFEKSDKDTTKIFQLIEETNETLNQLKNNQYKPRRAA